SGAGHDLIARERAARDRQVVVETEDATPGRSREFGSGSASRQRPADGLIVRHDTIRDGHRPEPTLYGAPIAATDGRDAVSSGSAESLVGKQPASREGERSLTGIIAEIPDGAGERSPGTRAESLIVAERRTRDTHCPVQVIDSP